MSDFEDWVEFHKINWREKTQWEKTVYHPPQHKLVLKEYVVADWFMYPPKDQDVRQEALNLYSLIEGHMSIAMERELVLELQDRIRKHEERRNHGQQ